MIFDSQGHKQTQDPLHLLQLKDDKCLKFVVPKLSRGLFCCSLDKPRAYEGTLDLYIRSVRTLIFFGTACKI